MKTLTRQQRIVAYQEVCRLAEANALILKGYGGVLTLVHPDTQEQEGVMDQCLRMADASEKPKAEAG